MSTRIDDASRADLLRLIDGKGAHDQEALAALLGFERREPPPKELGKEADHDSRHPEQPVNPPPKAKPTPRAGPTDTAPTFWRVVAHRSIRAPELVDDDVPAWWREPGSPLGDEERRVEPESVEDASLVHWPRLLGFLRSHLVVEQCSQGPDERRLVRLLAAARPFSRIPRKVYRRWPGKVVVVSDQSEALYPLWRDYARLRKRLRDLIGARLQVICIEAHPDPLRTEFERMLAHADLSPESVTSARWLLLTDAGAAEASSWRATYWRAFLRWLTAYPLRAPPLLLVNAPPSRWGPDLGRIAAAAHWDLDQPLRLSRDSPSPRKPGDSGVDALLAMLAMAAEARPRLLRKLRRLLPASSHDVSWEILAWNHPDVRQFLPDCYVDPIRKPHYQARFRAYQESVNHPDGWPQRALTVIADEHAGARPFVRDQERALSRAALQAPDERQDYLVDALRALLFREQSSERDFLSRWADRLIAATDGALIAANDKLGALERLVHVERAARGGAIAPRNPKFDFLFKSLPVRECELWQRGLGFCVTIADHGRQPVAGSPIGKLSTQDGIIGIGPDEKAGGSEEFWSSKAPPSWANAWGRDSMGAWVDIQIESTNRKLVTQRLRWIEAGSFAMGSPETEAGRESDETEHRVTISEGYWLADTACTLALWQAVMGDNPSRFRGAERPVEMVSWDQVGTFIERLNQRVPGLNVRLPTEAEWEYACRAGTRTPFHFGETIDTDHVNFNGNYPYAGGKRGEYRKQTIEVKALPCNGWGLYQMHGNVWEWCSDWYGEYPTEAAVDLKGPARGEWRVLRGGGWGDGGWGVRSAFRDRRAPDERRGDAGFRVARGQSGAEPAGPQPAPQAERRAAEERPRVATVPRVGAGAAAKPLQHGAGRLAVHTDHELVVLERVAKPAWAQAMGRDRHGLFADFALEEVRQRMRWINPGRFTMGSQKSERERSNNETPHEVTISEGYWLADTACTQALWQAVMTEEPGLLAKVFGRASPALNKLSNPSHFQGAECPVENVSLEQMGLFIERLNRRVPGLDVRFPTEAEWEYACRASTSTPFCFRETTDTDHANFDGNHPYAGGKRGEYREQTVEVKALPCNGWGLYQMHGNVWEWCSDWYGEYPREAVVDPKGPASGEGRVLRGGSWRDDGRRARSAFRGHGAPGVRGDDAGFRLARGQ